MQCPFCSDTESKVTNKRISPSGLRRRRECLKCRKRFTTYERIELSDLFVVKKDGGRERFDACKLRAGVERAFEKRPVSQEAVMWMLARVEEGLRKKGKEVDSRTIGEFVMKEMKKIDSVAYVRFASVYKDFKDMNDFSKEIREVKK